MGIYWGVLESRFQTSDPGELHDCVRSGMTAKDRRIAQENRLVSSSLIAPICVAQHPEPKSGDPCVGTLLKQGCM